MSARKGYTREDLDRMVASGMRIQHEQDRRALAGLLARWLAGGDDDLAQHTLSELERQGLPPEVVPDEVTRGLDMVPAWMVRTAVAQHVEDVRIEQPTLDELIKWANTSSGPHKAIYAGLADLLTARRDGITSRMKGSYMYDTPHPPPGELWQSVRSWGEESLDCEPVTAEEDG